MHIIGSPKQHIYQRMLINVHKFRYIAYFSTSEGLSDADRGQIKDLAELADLLHGIVRPIISEGVTDSDVDFLNRQGRFFVENANCDNEDFIYYKYMIKCLFDIVEPQRPGDLQWPGPTMSDEDLSSLGL